MKKAIVIGAGPAGLTFAYELLEQTDIIPTIFEMSEDIGGISKTVEYKGNRIDIGGHRFFSKSDKVMDWWLNILPLETSSQINPEVTDDVMLLRSRLSRIFFLRKFFDYPVSLSMTTILNLGFWRIFKIGLSYINACIFPITPEKSLEDFFINRFGKELYETFFKDYTEKVWGVPCSEIKPEWGAQRVKGLSITKTILHALKKTLNKKTFTPEETSLIEQFMYPKFGPGYLWEQVAKRINEKGGVVNVNQKLVAINLSDSKIKSVSIQNTKTGEITEHFADYFISTMPVKDLIEAIGQEVPQEVKNVAHGLKYRDFITVGLLLKELKVKNKKTNELIKDNWIYIQERDVKLGRLQIFNNWSPYMVENPKNVWMGLEYFCNEHDELWDMPEDKFSEFAIDELAKIDIIDKNDVLDSKVIKIQKAYPAYFGTYDEFDTVKNYTDKIENLFLIGRNGMHRYNNMDHSMMTAMIAVENIKNDITTKENLWSVNVEESYHEAK